MTGAKKAYRQPRNKEKENLEKKCRMNECILKEDV